MKAKSYIKFRRCVIHKTCAQQEYYAGTYEQHKNDNEIEKDESNYSRYEGNYKYNEQIFHRNRKNISRKS